MAVPQNKQELLSAINTTFDKLLIDLKSVPDTEAFIVSLEGHVKDTQMSVANLVAYLIGWNELVLKWLDHDSNGQPTDFPETGFKWNELGRLAQKFYADYAGIDYPTLLARLERAKCRIAAEIEARDNEQLYGRDWYTKWTMGRMIQFNTSSPYANARVRLRKWRKAKATA